MTDANSCIIEECRNEDVNPVERKTIILVQIMRLEPPPAGIIMRPSRCVGPFVICSPPLQLQVEAIVLRGFEVKPHKLAPLGSIGRALREVIEDTSRGAEAPRRLRQGKLLGTGESAVVEA